MGNSKSKKKEVYVPVNLYNLKGHLINRTDEGYYNLQTNRRNKDKRSGMLYDEFYKVGGTEEEMKAFYELNYITENTVCNMKGKNTILYAPNIDDIAKIPDAMLDTVCPFNIAGLRSKAKVVEIIDGDTFIIAFYLPLKFLFEPHLYQHERKSLADEKEVQIHTKQKALLKSPKPTSKKIQEGGLFMKMMVRLLSMDAFEHATKAGDKATEVTKELYDKLGGICYIQCGYFDKYGRLLVDIYQDPKYTIYLNDYLIKHPDPILGPLAESYGGGTKSDYAKNLPRIHQT